MSSSGTGYMYNNAALYVSGAMALSQSAYLSWGGGLNDTTSVGFFQNKNGTLMFKDHTTGSWTELGNTRDNTQLGDSASDVVTANGQFTASVGAFMSSGKKLRLGAAEEAIYGDGTDIHFEVGSNGDINIPANIGLTFGDDGEKIEGDGTDLTVASSNNLTLDAGGDIILDTDDSTVYFKDGGTQYAQLSSDQGFTLNGALAVSGSVTLGDAVADIITSTGQLTASVGAFLSSGKKLRIGAAEEAIYGDGTDIHIEVGANGDINIPANIGLTFGDDGEKIEGDGTDLTISGGEITLDSEGDINIDADGSTVYFKDAGTVYARLSSDQGFTVNGALAASGSVTLGDAAADVVTVTGQLTASEGLNIPDNERFSFGTGAQSDMYFQNTGATGSLSSSLAFDINMADDTENAFTIKDSAATYFSIDTRDTTNATGGNVTLATGVGGDLTLDAAGGNIYFQQGGTTRGLIGLGAANDLIFRDAGSTEIFRIDGSADSLLIASTKKIEFSDANAYIHHDGATGVVIADDAAITLDANTDINLDANGGEVFFKDNGVQQGALKMDTSNKFILSSSISTNDVYLMSGRDMVLDADGGQVHIKDSDASHFLFDCDNTALTIYDDEDDGDLFSITVAQHGATTIATVDDDARAAHLTLDPDGDLILDPASAAVIPPTDNTVDLGSGAKRWANVYTADLHLKNDRGDWTIVEEEDYLCVVNNKTNKRYKMMLEEIQD
jgi:hypothetical protein